MTGGTRAEFMSLLQSRRPFLEALSETALTQADLARELDVSRSTVTRAVQSLEEAGLIVGTGSTYEITALGMAARRSLERYRETIDAVREARDFLQYLPSQAPFEPVLLREGTYYLIEPAHSYRIQERVNEAFREARRIEGISRTRSAIEAVPIFRQKIVEEGRPVEMVLSADLYDHVRSAFEEDAVFERDHVSVRVADSIPYGLFVIDRDSTETMVLVVYDESDAMKGVLFNETDTAVSWARAVIESMAEDAIPEDIAAESY
jgi:predicted transcriptional regulator